MKKLIATVLLALSLTMSLTACGQTKEEATPVSNEQSVLVMGTSPDYPPYEYYTDASLSQYGGIDVEVAKHIATSMNMELQIEKMNFDYLVTSLANGDFDMVLAACEYSEDRAQACDFSDPYYTDLPPVILVKAENADKYTSEADINQADVIIGAQKNTTKATAAAAKFDVAAPNMVTESLVTNLVTELKNGDLDLLVLDGNVGTQYDEENDDLVMLDAGVVWDSVEPYRVLVQKGDPKGLLEGINKAIAEMDIAAIEEIVASQEVYMAE